MVGSVDGLINIAVFVFFGLIVFKLVKSLFKTCFVFISKIMYFVNTIIASACVFAVSYTFLLQVVKFGHPVIASVIIAIIAAGFISYFGHSTDYPKLEYFIHVVFGIIDGIYVGCFINELLIPKLFTSAPKIYTAVAYIASVILMVVISFSEKHSADYYIE